MGGTSSSISETSSAGSAIRSGASLVGRSGARSHYRRSSCLYHHFRWRLRGRRTFAGPTWAIGSASTRVTRQSAKTWRVDSEFTTTLHRFEEKASQAHSVGYFEKLVYQQLKESTIVPRIYEELVPKPPSTVEVVLEIAEN
ncbi:hypothetical protein FGIG_00081 [Fasciola gigantica]|uniref:Uncharacterized protein n=1 Tax=Fasciola gigantica TaxID=46835 RepID=A0A504Z0C0_FASGI|nr:hypothetical protein FGIG_00081 [Fasciola gigantica]